METVEFSVPYTLRFISRSFDNTQFHYKDNHDLNNISKPIKYIFPLRSSWNAEFPVIFAFDRRERKKNIGTRVENKLFLSPENV